jgi:hypothetical protein
MRYAVQVLLACQPRSCCGLVYSPRMKQQISRHGSSSCIMNILLCSCVQRTRPAMEITTLKSKPWEFLLAMRLASFSQNLVMVIRGSLAVESSVNTEQSHVQRTVPRRKIVHSWDHSGKKFPQPETRKMLEQKKKIQGELGLLVQRTGQEMDSCMPFSPGRRVVRPRGGGDM